MYSLTTLRKINAEAAKAPRHETDATRRCSYKRSRAGIVLHSARQRSTAFIEGRRADLFEAAWLGTNSAEKRDQIVESYFRSVATGKQTKVS